MHRVTALAVAAVLAVAACSGSGSSPTAVNSDRGSATSDPSGSTDDPVVTDVVGTVAESSVPAPDPVLDSGTLEWAPCPEQDNPFAATQCATLQVPLDHSDPEGEQIDIAVARVVTSDPGQRIGSLVLNPGGPGGSGIDFLNQATVVIPPDVSARFDLVSFDPRGVGVSTALACDVEIDDNVTLLAAGDDAGWQALVDEADAIAEQCSADTLELANHVGTNNVARDLDLLRTALGDDALTYVGYSYGTRLGATYAELFPDRVRALVLDGGVKPTSDFHQLDLGQAEGFDRALENFAAACDSDDDCILGDLGPTLDVIEALRTEIAELGSFPTDDPNRVVTPGEFDLGVIAALYSKSSWPFLAEALFVADATQDATLLQILGDQYVGRQPDGTYANTRVANGFINCADDAARPSPDEARALAEEVAAQSVYFDTALRASTGCVGFAPAADPLVVGSAAEAPPILVVGNSGDPATPFEWSVELADSLASAVLFTVDAEGHTAYGTIECATDPIDAYLVDLVIPAEGAGCSDNADADFFVPAGESDVDLFVSLFDCLRENGLDIPEIGTAEILADPTGETFLEFLDPNDPAVAAAIQACGDIVLELSGS